MATVTVRSQSGSDRGTVDLDEATFGIEPNVPVMHQVVVAQLAARRAGTQSTKTRAEVSGGGAKPFKQKGTGRARQGSTRSPQWRGGGVALGPKPRSYEQRTPKKMKRLALRSALSDRAGDDKVIVVDAWSFDSPSTKTAVEALAKLGVIARAIADADTIVAGLAGHEQNAKELKAAAEAARKDKEAAEAELSDIRASITAAKAEGKKLAEAAKAKAESVVKAAEEKASAIVADAEAKSAKAAADAASALQSAIDADEKRAAAAADLNDLLAKIDDAKAKLRALVA